MGEVYNQFSRNDLRKMLRNNMPKAEVVLWQFLRNKQMNGFKFRRQFSIGSYVVDFYCPKLKLAIELDGDSHLGAEAEQYDFERQHYIEQYGIKFIRFTNDDVYNNVDGVVEELLNNIPSSTEEGSRGGLY